MDAVDDQSDLVDWQRELLVGFGCNLDWPVVSAEVLNRADVNYVLGSVDWSSKPGQEKSAKSDCSSSKAAQTERAPRCSPIVKHEYAGRRWRTPAEVDQHDVTIVQCRHHAVALDVHDA